MHVLFKLNYLKQQSIRNLYRGINNVANTSSNILDPMFLNLIRTRKKRMFFTFHFDKRTIFQFSASRRDGSWGFFFCSFFLPERKTGNVCRQVSCQLFKAVTLQMGHRFFTINHCLMHFIWNSCPHSIVPMSSAVTYSS